RGGKRNLHSLARLLGAGVEVEFGIENTHIVGARVVVDDPQAPALWQRNMGGMKRLVVLRDGRDPHRRRAGTGGHCDPTRRGRGASPALVSVSRTTIRFFRPSSESLSPRGRSFDRVGRSTTPLT